MESSHSLSVFDSQHRLVTSPAFSPWTLSFIRLSLALYTFCTTVFLLVWECIETHDEIRCADTEYICAWTVVNDGVFAYSYLSYFTHLSYIGLCAYFFAAGTQTLSYARESLKWYPLQSWPRTLQFLHGLLYSTIVTFREFRCITPIGP